MRRLFEAAILSILATAVAAQEPAGPPDSDRLFARDPYTLTPIVCPFKGEVKYKPGEISCGLLTVPENRESDASRMIELHYVKLAARKPKDWDKKGKGDWAKRDDPVIYLTGGPGAPATGYVKRLKDHGVRDVRDLYILEQRGVGYSQDFCPLYFLVDPAASNTPDYDAYQRANIAAAEACFAAAKARGVDLSAYNTIENARDVKALRRALGFERWNLWGISYGSILGQAYLREDPEGIRAAAIDAIVPIEPGAPFQKIGGSFARDLALLEEACNEDPACAKTFPDLIDRYERAVAAVIAEPIEVEAIDTELFPSGKGYFFRDLAAGAVFAQFYEQKNYAILPAFIAAFTKMIETKDYDAFRILTAGGPGGIFGGSSQGMYNAIACNDNWIGYLRGLREEDLRENPVFAAIQGPPDQADEMAARCLWHGMAPRPAEQYAPLVTDIRTLIIEGEMDPITPPPFAQMILPGFSNGTYVEFPYAGHGPSRSVRCAGEFLTKYFDDPNGALDLACPESMEAPKFTGALYPARGHLKLAALAAEDEKKAALPVLWGGGAALVLILAALIYTLAPAARLINGQGAAPTGGARPLAWATAVAGAASALGLGYALYATFKASELALLAGMVPVARLFVYAGLAAGVLGLVLLVLTVGARAREKLPVGVLIGLAFTGLAGAALAAFYLAFGFAVL